MTEYNVAETFLSINGEGTHAGQLAFFIRFTGCNLNCEYCDTRWANLPDATHTKMTAEEISGLVQKSGCKNITITGGEPLIQPGIFQLLTLLSQSGDHYIEIETNGSVPLNSFMEISNRPSFTMDYKLSASGMEQYMCRENFALLDLRDTVKFVCGSRDDLLRAKEITETYSLTQKTNVYLSPVFGKINPAYMVDFMKEYNLNDVTLQLQMHKVIWNPNERGV